MPRIYEGYLTGRARSFGIVVARFNYFIGEKLLDGALDSLRRHEVADDDISVVYVPGAFELPLAAKKLCQSGQFDAVICLGAVIRGATPHFDYVAGNLASGLATVSLQTGVPCILGVLTTDTIDQAIERAGTKAGNNGANAAATAIEMADLYGRSLVKLLQTVSDQEDYADIGDFTGQHIELEPDLS